MPRRIFISHKNTPESNDASDKIYQFLKAQGHEPFFDKQSLHFGVNWKNAIITDLTASDLVILIVDESTNQSSWVQREVDMASALNIQIIPVVLNAHAEITGEFKHFGIEEIQFAEYIREPEDAHHSFLQSIHERIEPLASATYLAQAEVWKEWRLRNRIIKTVAVRNSAAVVLNHPQVPGLVFHLASGDSSLCKNFDVLVNTENNYMQMARFFETKTLSYAIRTNGAFIKDGEILVEDTVQDQLSKVVAATGGAPVRDRRVLVTGAGHEKSRMRRTTNYRYIFHTAAVRIRLTDQSVEPVDGIDRIIKNCIEKIEEVDTASGAIEIDKSLSLILPDENYRPIESILFPPFGTGEGGHSLQKAVEMMVQIFIRDVKPLIDDHDLQLKKIGLSIYFEEDIAPIVDIFLNHGFEIVSP